METKDLMWAVWCLLCGFGAFKLGHFLGFKLGIEVAKATIGKLIVEGKLDVPESIQKPIHETNKA
jgi:hypothetical protein